MTYQQYKSKKSRMNELLQREFTDAEADEIIELAFKTKSYELKAPKRIYINWEAVIAYSLILVITSLLIFLIV